MTSLLTVKTPGRDIKQHCSCRTRSHCCVGMCVSAKCAFLTPSSNAGIFSLLLFQLLPHLCERFRLGFVYFLYQCSWAVLHGNTVLHFPSKQGPLVVKAAQYLLTVDSKCTTAADYNKDQWECLRIIINTRCMGCLELPALKWKTNIVYESVVCFAIMLISHLHTYVLCVSIP